MATDLYLSLKARENALKSPEAAASYLFDQNKSTYTSVDEASAALDAIEKFAYSTASARAFCDKWDSLNGSKKQIRLNGSGFGDFTSIQKKIASVGDHIRDLASKSSSNATTSTVNQQSSPSSYNKETGKLAEDLWQGIVDTGKSAIESVSSAHATRTINSNGVNARDPANYKKVVGTLNKGTVVTVTGQPSAGAGFPDSPKFLTVTVSSLGGKKDVSVAVAEQFLPTSFTSQPETKKPSTGTSSSKKPSLPKSPSALDYSTPSASLLENKVFLGVAAVVIGTVAFKLLYNPKPSDQIEAR